MHMAFLRDVTEQAVKQYQKAKVCLRLYQKLLPVALLSCSTPLPR